MKKRLFSFIALGALLCSTGFVSARPKAQPKRSCFSCQDPDFCCPKKLDPLVGVWLCNTTILPNTPDAFPAFATVTFNADGTLHLSDSVSLSQPTPPFPAGGYGSLFHGLWKRIGKRKYKLLYTDLINEKDTNDPNLPGIPFERAKWVADFEMDLNNQAATIGGTLQFFLIDDIALANPQSPMLPFAGDCLKLNFD